VSEERAVRGIAVGKFWPPHHGHHAMIDHLAAQCERTLVLVCATPTQVPSGLDRALWLQQVHPGAEVVVCDDFCDWHFPHGCLEECSREWADRVNELGLGPVDVVVSSESYGERFAGLLGARHVDFDPERSAHPVSGTAVRASLADSWGSLHPVTRAGMFRRVVVLGAESTGTTTLVNDLSSALGLPCTPELGRTVSWELYARTGDMAAVTWTERHFWTIVNAQVRTELLALHAAEAAAPGPLGPWLVCDTDTLATVAWWERYLKSPSAPLLEFASARLADLYVITSPDGVEFDDSDPTRDGRHVRRSMHERLVELVRASGRPWLTVEGGRSARVAQVEAALLGHESRYPRFAR
jgi:NadR type nicotinamide-nucleotide adenylyltransferase